MITPEQLVAQVLAGAEPVELHWLEWKSDVDLSVREWQARAAKFILGAANRPLHQAQGAHRGHAFMLMGLEPHHAVGTRLVDPTQVDDGLIRYLGTAGPAYILNYVTIHAVSVAVITIPPTSAGNRPHLARGTMDGPRKPVIQDGRIYIRRGSSTTEASAVEVDEMLTERVGARIAAGPRWPLQPVEAWRDGRKVHVQLERGDHVMIHGEDRYTNMMEMARERPQLPPEVPAEIVDKVTARFAFVTNLIDPNPARAIVEALALLDELSLEVHRSLLDHAPPSKMIDMVGELAGAGHLEPGWVNVAYPLYYWPIEQERQQLKVTHTGARTWLSLANSLATALLLALNNT